MRRVIVCGPPHSGKSVLLANLMRLLPPDSFYLAFAAPDGEWHWSNFGDQDLVAAVRQKGKFTENFVGSMVEAIKALGQARTAMVGVHTELTEAKLRLGVRTSLGGIENKPNFMRKADKTQMRDAG